MSKTEQKEVSEVTVPEKKETPKAAAPVTLEKESGVSFGRVITTFNAMGWHCLELPTKTLRLHGRDCYVTADALEIKILDADPMLYRVTDAEVV